MVENQDLLLLLDGLDEVKVELQNSCIKALNEFIQSYGITEMVVCSRIRDYESLKDVLKLQKAILIQPLTQVQVNEFLERAGEQLEGVRCAMQTDRVLQELGKSPLVLSVMALAYQGMSQEQLPKSSVENRYKDLFSTYIERMLERRRFNRQYQLSPYSPHKTKIFLNWLAQRMLASSQTIFLIERIQPSWLQASTQKRSYYLSVMLIVGIIQFLLCFFFLSRYQERINVLDWLSIASLAIMAGLFGGLKKEIRTFESLKWSWLWSWTINFSRLDLLLNEIFIAIKTFFFLTAPFGGLAGFVTGIDTTESGLWYGLFNSSLSDRFVDRLAVGFLGLFGGIFFGGFALGVISGVIWVVLYKWIIWDFFIRSLILGFVYELKGPDIKQKSFPNEGIWRSVAYCIISALAGGLLLAVIFGILGLFSSVVDSSLEIDFIKRGLYLGGFSGALIGGLPPAISCIQHLLLRVFLFYSGCIPWNYKHFLNFADERIFMQKVGGGYIFIHRMLMEHFAQMKLEQERR